MCVTSRLHAGMRGLIVGVLLLVAATAFSEKPPSTSLEQTDELIDLYCASVDPEMRSHCLADIIDPLKDAANVRRLTLLAKALRTLRDWTDDEPELTDDLRRREQNAYRAILRLDPGHSEAMFFLAVSHEDEEDQNTLLRELLRVHPGDAAASRVLAMNLQRNGNVDDAREAFHVLRMAYKEADSKVRILLAAEAASALARVDKKASAEFRQSVKKESGVVSILARAAATVKSGASISEKIAAAKVVIDEFCLEPYLLFDTEACHQGIELMLQLEESAPRDPQILQALIDGMQGLHKPNFGSTHDYDEELRDRIERLIDVEGSSVALLSDYAAVLKGEEQITVLQSIVATDRTSSAKIHAMLGRALINAGRNVEGIDQLRTAFERAVGRDRDLYGAELVQALRFYGMPQDAIEANQIERILQQS